MRLPFMRTRPLHVKRTAWAKEHGAPRPGRAPVGVLGVGNAVTSLLDDRPLVEVSDCIAVAPIQPLPLIEPARPGARQRRTAGTVVNVDEARPTPARQTWSERICAGQDDEFHLFGAIGCEGWRSA